MRVVCPIFVLCVSLVAFSEEAMSQVIEEVAFGNAVEALAIRIDGEITAETPDALREFIERENPEAYTVLLNSPGGNRASVVRLLSGLRLHGRVDQFSHPLAHAIVSEQGYARSPAGAATAM